MRIILLVLDEEFGSTLTPELRAAWTKCLNYGFSLLLKDAAKSTSSVLSTNDIQLVRKSWTAIRNNVNIPARGLIR